MSRSLNVAAHYSRLMTRWPVDGIRPENLHFQRLLQARLKATTEVTSSETTDSARQVNAAYLLLDNSFSKRYTLSSKVMKPASRPTLYEELDRELQEGPRRGFLDYIWRRMTSMIRRR